MAETNFTASENLNLIGLQYKHWKNEHLGYRLIAAHRSYQAVSPRSSATMLGDTLFTTKRNTDIQMAFLGAGVEMQRHFYKKIYLFVAVELRGGYGTGGYYNALTIEKQNGSFYEHSTTPKINGARMLTVEMAPTIGAKMQHRNLCVGLEVSFAQFAYNSIKYPLTTSPSLVNDTADFNAGELAQRVFVHYRF